MASAYDLDLGGRSANCASLSPLSFLPRTRDLHADRPAVLYAARFILVHAEARVFLVDKECGPLALAALDYEALLGEGSLDAPWSLPEDERDAISLNYTSGSTGSLKGVIYHDCGAYLNAVSNGLTWNMSEQPIHLWTLPTFHCNGWCFAWTLAVPAGLSVCVRHVRGHRVFGAIEARRVSTMTAGAAPPAAVIQGMEALGFANPRATAEEIIGFCRERVARSTVPKHVVFGDLPKTSTGEIQKFPLRQSAEAL